MYLQFVSDLRNFGLPNDVLFATADFDHFPGLIQSGDFAELTTARMYIGCTLLRIAGKEDCGVQLLQQTMPMVEDLSLPKSMGYFHLGLAYCRSDADFDTWVFLLEDQKRKTGTADSSATLLESYRHQRHVLPVPQTKKICLALGSVCGRRDSAQTAYYLNMALGNTLRHQLGSGAVESVKRKVIASARDPEVAQELVQCILQPCADAGGADPVVHANQFLDDFGPHLPDSMAICTMCLSEDRSKLYVVRMEYGAPRAVLALPLERDGDNLLTGTLAQLSGILQENNDVCKMQPKGKDEIKAWHATRKQLDHQVYALLQELQRRVFGCWKGLLLGSFVDCRARTAFDDIVASCTEMLNCILRKAMGECQSVDVGLVRVLLLGVWPVPSAETKDGQALVQGLALLLGWEPPLTSEQEEELLDFYDAARELCSGLPEEGLGGKALRQHTVLILDTVCHGLPWESLPVLAHHSVSRVPSLYYLRLQLTKYDRGAEGSVLRDGIDADKVYYVLDPQNDLPRTRERFSAFFASKPPWRGVTGCPPSAEQFRDGLTDFDCFLYLGHGTGDKYVSRASVRMVQRCGVVMLLGCSSGKLSTVADLDPQGAPLNFLLAGSPCVVSNLWDVTDKEIDKVAQELLATWTEQDPTQFNTEACLNSQGMLRQHSLCDLLPQAREACKLRYLTGAATVCYGLPVYVKCQSPRDPPFA